MADFVSEFWHWFIIIPTVVSILALFPLIYLNRGSEDQSTTKTGHVWDDDLEEYNNPLPGWWLNMFVITLIFSIVYLILYPGLGHFEGVLGWTSNKQYTEQLEAAQNTYAPIYDKYASTDIRTLVKDPAAIDTGERLYATYCTGCHGSDARGAKGFPNLRDHDWLYGGEPGQIKTSILNGRAGIMPGWEAVVGEAGVADAAEYVLSLSGQDHSAEAAARGKTHYTTLCVACHQADGTGNPLLGAPNLTDRVWLYGGSRDTITESIAQGRAGNMPAHKEFLGESRIHILAAYVYSLSQERENE